MYKDIQVLQPYFYSIREVNEVLCLDIKIPVKWKYAPILLKYDSIKLKEQDKNEENTLITLITKSTCDGYDDINNCAREIIKTNKDEEEKLSLFNEKVSALQELFMNMSLDELKNINFETNGRKTEKGNEDVGIGEK